MKEIIENGVFKKPSELITPKPIRSDKISKVNNPANTLILFSKNKAETLLKVVAILNHNAGRNAIKIANIHDVETADH